MKLFLIALTCVAGLAIAGCADMSVMSASVELRSAPPPPRVYFDSDPRWVYLSDLRVSVISDDSFGYDMFRCGGSYYMFSAGFWYQSSSPTGTWTACEERRVPRQIFEVDDQRYHWRNHPQNWRGGKQHADRGEHRGWDHNGHNDNHD